MEKLSSLVVSIALLMCLWLNEAIQCESNLAFAYWIWSARHLIEIRVCPW